MINKKKKKGFTLVELIAVIAILAILGALLVPKVGGYTTRATQSKDLANAKQLLQAIEMYNTQNDATLTTVDKTSLSTVISSWPQNPKTVALKTTLAALNPSIAISADITVGEAWTSISLDDLKAYAEYLQTIAK